MLIRHATINDKKALAAVELECFPVAEAATEKSIGERLQFYANHFWLLFDNDILIGFLDGMVTNERDLTDSMYDNANMHNEQGAWQMIFGVNTIPAYRRQGNAERLLNQAIAEAKEQGRQGVVLTCKEALLHYYAKFGFKNEGVSKSVHGNVVWYQMRLTF